MRPPRTPDTPPRRCHGVQDMYPELLGKMLIVNPPWAFPIAFNVVKPWLDPKTQAKIEVVSGDPSARLDEARFGFIRSARVYAERILRRRATDGRRRVTQGGVAPSETRELPPLARPPLLSKASKRTPPSPSPARAGRRRCARRRRPDPV